jgi:photosystem II stability/assembly factor-like uncharacterized protein
VLAAAALLPNSVPQTGAQDWVVTSAPKKADWYSLASSADGNKLVASIRSEGIFTSTNGGANWTPTPAPNGVWQVASSADGTKLVIAGGRLYRSTNSGATWTESIVPVIGILSIASSADGSKLTAVGWGGVLSSTDSGVTWTNYPNLQFAYVACSADGSKLVAGGFGAPKPVYLSTNSGATWTGLSGDLFDLGGLACSADGNRLAIVDSRLGSTNSIYVSTNLGGSWTRTSAPPNDYYKGIASSADGIKLVAPGYPVWLSTNSGATWNSIGAENACRHTCALSADGNRITIAVPGGGCAGTISVRQTPPAPPKLSLRFSSNNLVLSWLVPSLPFSLQARPDLSVGDWTNVVATPTLNCTNLNYEVTLPTTAQGAVFYRLSLE